MKTWMKAIPLIAGLALLASALAAPARADDDDDDDRRRGDYIQLADHKSHGKHHGHKRSHGKHYGHKRGHGKHYGHKRGYRQGYRQGYRHGHKHGGHRYGHKRGHGHKHYGHRRHYGHGHKHNYGHRYYVPYPAFVFRYYHNSSYEAPAERVPHVQPQVTQAVATSVAQSDSWPETCLMAREYQTEITVGGEVVEGYGQACLQPDGSWYRGPAVAVQ